MARPTSRTPLRALLLLLLISFALSGCGKDYSSRMDDVLRAVHAQRSDTALDAVDRLIKRAEANKKPERNNLTLLLLERASIYQALGRHEEATHDFLAADQMLEILDLTPQGARNAATFLFSDDSKVYHAPIYEKLLVNISALSSFLALGNYQSAAVEARRIFVLTEYFEGTELYQHPMLATAYSIAGLAFELAGDNTAARHAYARALSIQPKSTFIDRSHDYIRNPRKRPTEEIIIIVLSGTGPTKVAQAFPVGVVLGWLDDRTPLGDSEHNIIVGLSAEELTNWVRFPILVRNENVASQWVLQMDGGQATTLEELSDIASFAIDQWQQARPTIAWSAITRFVTRYVARQALQQSGRAVGGIGGAIMSIAGLATQTAMLAADTPDTRAWNTIPAGVHITRIPASAGTHQIRLQAAGGVYATIPATITIPEGGRAIITVRTFN